MRKRRAIIVAAFLAVATSALAQRPAWDAVPTAMDARAPDLVLTGTVDESDRYTVVEVPFDVPEDVIRIGVTLDYTGKRQPTVINSGIFDGERFRGWSGSNKASFVIGESDATPSYVPGPVSGRRWVLNLGISAIRGTSKYTAEIRFWRKGDEPAVSTFSPDPLEQGPRWYRGDFHLHTGYSDGFCLSRRGRKVPCPLQRTVERALEQNLDFIAITDHNNTSHFHTMRELQPYFDDVLLIPGREITTSQGHANIFGSTQFVDYRLGQYAVPTMNDILEEAVGAGATVSINHPAAPTNEKCRGCGWTPAKTDFSRVAAIEAVNGGDAWAQMGQSRRARGSGESTNLEWWTARLNEGLKLTGIGGSDNHDVDMGRFGVGFPTTGVYAENLSERAILDAVSAGRVFIDLTGERAGFLDVRAQAGERSVMMGATLAAPKSAAVTFEVRTDSNTAGTLYAVINGNEQPVADSGRVENGERIQRFVWPSDGERRWIRFEVRRDDRVALIGNPIYLNYEDD